MEKLYNALLKCVWEFDRLFSRISTIQWTKYGMSLVLFSSFETNTMVLVVELNIFSVIRFFEINSFFFFTVIF